MPESSCPSRRGPRLPVLSEKSIHRPVNQETFKYCPTMDLIAFATDEHQVFVYRLNGQLVYCTMKKGANTTISRLRWKPDGRLLAIAWSDGFVRLIGSDNSKVVHVLGVENDSPPSITCIGWGCNDVKGSPISFLSSALKGSLLSDISTETNDESKVEKPMDLPRDLATSDIESSLPKLSVLPSLGMDEDIFSSRMSVDAMFHGPSKTISETIDILILGYADGSLHLTIFDSFVIGTFDLNHFSGLSGSLFLRQHSSHSSQSTHSLLLSKSEPLKESSSRALYFMPMDLRFISSTGDYLPTLAAKTTQLQNLLRYIHQAQVLLRHEWKASQDLPLKFIRNIEESLMEDTHCGFVHACFHLAVTGDCYPPMKEWLVEQLAERGHKRWHSAVMFGYETVRRLTHENLIPALERCSIAVSRLRGLARYQDSTASLGLSTRGLSDILGTLKCLILMSHKILKYAGSEIEAFRSFSEWIRHEIDVQATDPTSTVAEDPTAKDTGIDFGKVLEYLQGPLLRSKLEPMLIGLASSNRRNWDKSIDGTRLYESLADELKRHDTGSSPKLGLLTCMDLHDILQTHCSTLFSNIAEAERRNVLFGSPIPLGNDFEGSSADMKTIAEDGGCVTYVLLQSARSRSLIIMYRITLQLQNGVTSSRQIESAATHLGDGIIDDAKFVNDQSIMLLWRRHGEPSRMVEMLFRPSPTDTRIFIYLTHNARSSAQIEEAHERQALRMTNSEVKSSHTAHVFDDSMNPGQLEINGHEERRVVCTLAKDCSRYTAFDLDSQVPEENSLVEMECTA